MNTHNDSGLGINIHPSKIGLYLLLISLSFIFFGLSASYVYNRWETGIPPIQVPSLFVLNTLILLASSATVHWANLAYRKDDTAQYQWALAATLLLTLAFAGAQYVAWQQLFAQNSAALAQANSRNYLYVISWAHLLHVLGGIPFLALFLVTAIRRMKEPVSVLVYFSDPVKKMRLQLLTLYWHFLDALWMYLVLFFWANYLIQ